MRPPKKALNFDLHRVPGKSRDPLDQMIQFASQHTCKAKGMAIAWSDGQTTCFLEGGMDDTKLGRVALLTSCHHLPQAVTTIRQLKEALDNALAATNSGNMDVGMINDALLAANDVLYKLRTHWQCLSAKSSGRAGRKSHKAHANETKDTGSAG